MIRGNSSDPRTSQARERIVNDLIPLTAGGAEPCTAIGSHMPDSRNSSSMVEACEYARTCVRLGLMSLEFKEEIAWGITKFVVLMKPTEQGRVALSAALLDRQGDPLAKLEKWLRSDVLMVSTGIARIGKMLRKTDPESIAGHTISHLEFQYEVVPNVWAYVEKRTATASGLPNQQRTGSAVFQRWSDGGRLAAEPEFH